MRTLVAVACWTLSRTLARLGVRRTIRFGRWLGVLVFYCLPIRRRTVLDNLEHAFPEKTPAERWRLARDVYRQLGRVLLEIFLLPRLSPPERAALVRMHGVERIETALAEGRGVIVCMAHMGNWELIGYEGHRRGYDVCAITKRLQGSFNALLHETRRPLLRELPPRNSFQAGVGALRENAALALVIDQHHPGKHAVPVEFMGRPAATSAAPAVFHLRSGAPVLAAWMTVAEDDVYDIWIRGPFAVPSGGSQEERIRRHTQALTHDLELYVRTHPAEWFWLHRRWKVPAREPVHAAVPETVA